MILDEIAARTRIRIAEEAERISLSSLREMAESMPDKTGFPFEKALSSPGISLICELKKASPSRGMICDNFPFEDIAREYCEAGADAISCLTEPYWFNGKDEYIRTLTGGTCPVSIPVLRKDFTISPYMIYQAKCMGASAVLLICAILNDRELSEYLETAHSLGLSALVEAHTAEEVKRALSCGAKIIGVNNRNLQTFQVDITTSVRLRELVPDDRLYVSESGIRTPEDIRMLQKNGTDAVLIGEMLMDAENKKELIAEMKSICRTDKEKK